MAQISETRGLCAEQKEGRGIGGALVARTRESRGQNVIGLQSSGGEDETDVELLMWGAGNGSLERELGSVCSTKRKGRRMESWASFFVGCWVVVFVEEDRRR